MQTYNHIIIKLLISPHLRIIRHIILFIFTLSISAGLVWFAQDNGLEINTLKKYGCLFLFALIFLGGCYFNIYILTPKLLFKNKWNAHFCSLLAVAFLILTTVITFQSLLSKDNTDQVNLEVVSYFHFFRGIINLLSSTLAFFLLLAGISSLVLFQNWILDMKQSEELESITLQSELKLLENQINPHFLFNMLNNANIMIKKDPDVALHIIGKLEEMLCYLMNKCSSEKVYLNEEILFLTDFLELEKTRRDYFNYTISDEGETDNIQIAPLLFISFVENAVKHNQDSKANSYVHISFITTKDKLIFICENSIPQRPVNNEVGGIGLTNIKRRLNLLYNGNYSLEQTKTDTSYTVKLELKL